MIEHTCTRCGKNFSKLWKLRWHNERQYKCKPIARPQSLPLAPVVHAWGKNRRREKPEPIQASIPQDKNQENDPKADPGPSTQAYREGQASIKDQNI